jgi:hypothetical protein
MSARVCISASISYGNRTGGHAWLYLNWALGLELAGCEVVWLQTADRATPDEELAAYLTTIESTLAEHGVRARIALTAPGGEALRAEPSGRYLGIDEVAEWADLYLDLAYAGRPQLVRRFRRSAFVDQDPGLCQVWLRAGTLELADYGSYFTVGENVGRPGSPIPDVGIPWAYTPLPVALREWPVAPADEDAPFTTVSNWWSEDGWLKLNGTVLNNEKRTAFLEFVDLPSRTDVPLELALTLKPTGLDVDERRTLERHGWRVRPSWDDSWTPGAYRRYVQASRGEFTVAKPGYVALQTGMVTDRTLHYLASGKPAVVQNTGPSSLPEAEGIFRVRTPGEAADALRAATAEYERHCRAARELVEDRYEAGRVARGVLERALP